ncbi:MAG: DUF4238 domain-containing protein [Candidatus Binatia bacterium]
MSGKNQHYLPRFMLAGFASRRDGKQAWIYELRKGRQAVERNTRNVGAEGGFYRRGDDDRIDHELQDYEGEFGQLVNEIRSTDRIPTGSDDALAGLVTSLSVRTRAIRLAFGHAGQQIVAALGRYLNDPERVRRMMRDHLKKHPETLLEPVARELGVDPHDLPLVLRNRLLQQAEGLIDAPATTAKIKMLAGMMLRELEGRTSKEGIKEIHLTALGKGTLPSRRMDPAQRLTWSLRTLDPSSLILGDLGPIRLNESSGRYESLAKATDDPHSIFLPISHEHLLVGVDHHLATDCPLDVEAVNIAAAELSWEFVVARQSTKREAVYAEALGRWAELLPDDELHQIEEEVFGKVTAED